MNKQLYLLALLSILLGACKTEQAPKEEAIVNTQDFTIRPGDGMGFLTGDLTKAELLVQVGTGEVKEEPFYLGEGETAPGLLLYPGQDSEISVLLDDDSYPLLYRIDQASSPWRTEEGITVGSTLEEVVKANGNGFTFSGFDWDYGGRVTDWKGGKFDDASFGITFQYTVEGDIPAEDIAQIMGDIPVSSSNPILPKYNLRVAAITQSY